jgi:hypothetical protein
MSNHTLHFQLAMAQRRNPRPIPFEYLSACQHHRFGDFADYTRDTEAMKSNPEKCKTAFGKRINLRSHVLCISSSLSLGITTHAHEN